MRTSVLIVGIVFIALGIFAFFYNTVETDEDLGGLIEEDKVNYPFRNYSYPLVIGGVVLVILAFIIPTKEELKDTTFP